MAIEKRRRPLWLRMSEKVVSSRLGASILRPTMHLIDRPLLRLTRGRVSFASAYPVLLLTTKGAKSGKARSVPLLYQDWDGGFAVIRTRFGSTKHPGWYHNLRATPEATVEIKGQRYECAAREAREDERPEIWERAVATYSGYAAYEPRAQRRIPIMILTPKGDT